MALYFFVLLTLLKLALCLPDPNVKVDIDVDVDVDDKGCGPGGIPCNQKSCSFGGTVWPNGCFLTEACFKLKCTDGTWKYTEDLFLTVSKCGNCTFGGEPLIYTFDNLKGNNKYNSKPIITESNLTGEYIMTQPGVTKHAEFGVHGHFINDTKFTNCYSYTNCINGVTYYEAGVTITITITYVAWGSKKIKAFVNDKPFTIGSMVEYVYGTGGAILIFEHANIDGGGENCISVIGTKGLTVTLCESVNWSDWDYPWAFIYAMPALEGNPLSPPPNSQLYGLCNTWTGEDQECFTLHNGTCVDSSVWQCGTGTDDIDAGGWPYKQVPRLCDDVADTWKANMTSE